MDYDNDGILDIISGSYDPGDIYLIRGLGEGKYDNVESLVDENFNPLVHHPVEIEKFLELEGDSDAANSDEAIQFRVASFGSWPAMIDWDDDGDLDMLIGSFSGKMFLRMNIGTRDEPDFSKESIPVLAGGVALKESGHANPVVADWDSDGMKDLIEGSSNGRISWYRNVGSEEKPEFASASVLVPATGASKGSIQFRFPGEEIRPGGRTQICVTDYNGDGLLDILAGDYATVMPLKKVTEDEYALINEQIMKRRKAEQQQAVVQEKFFAKYQAGELTSEEIQKEMESLGFQEEMMDAFFKIKKFTTLKDEFETHSHVWVYLRKPTQ